MKLFLEPDSVALIGASGKLMRPGHHLFQNLQICFGDRFYPVNPRADRMTRTHRKPIVVWLLGDAARTPAVTRELESRGIPVAEDMGRGARMLAAVARGR